MREQESISGQEETKAGCGVISDIQVLERAIEANPFDEVALASLADEMTARDDPRAVDAWRNLHLLRIRSDPENDGPRLAYTTWLEENGWQDGAAYIRDSIQAGTVRMTQCRVGRSQLIPCIIRRGFAETYYVSWADWLRHHQAILSHPDVVLRQVELTTWPEIEVSPAWAPIKGVEVYIRWVSQNGRRAEARHLISQEEIDNSHGHCLASQIGRAEVLRQWRDTLPESFPGHCPNHPIEWVMPREGEEL